MSEITSGNRYKITNVEGGTVLDLSGTDNRTVSGFSSHGGTNQQWELQNVPGGWTFKNAGNGEFLGIDGEPQDGTGVVGVSEPFTWQIWRDEQDQSVYRIFVPNTTQNIDLSDHGNAAPGTKVTLWSKWEGKNQTWRFEQL